MMKEKVEKMQQAFRKAQGMDDILYTMSGLGSTPMEPLPHKFKISDSEKFDGSGDSWKHIRQYLSLVGMKGLNEKRALCAFPLSLMGNALRWYYNLDSSKAKVWNELMELFMDQFIFNTMINVTLRDLETTKQGFNETFSEYMMKWKNKVSRMVNMPNEKDQINMIIKNLVPAYNNRLLSSPINSFVDLCDCGMRIEDAINTGQLDLREAKLQAKKVFNEGEQGYALNNVNVVST